MGRSEDNKTQPPVPEKVQADTPKQENKRTIADVIKEADKALMITVKGASIEIHDIKGVKYVYEARGLLYSAIGVYEIRETQNIIGPFKEQMLNILGQVTVQIRSLAGLIDEGKK